MSVYYNTELSVILAILCCGQVPFIYMFKWGERQWKQFISLLWSFSETTYFCFDKSCQHMEWLMVISHGILSAKSTNFFIHYEGKISLFNVYFERNVPFTRFYFLHCHKSLLTLAYTQYLLHRSFQIGTSIPFLFLQALYFNKWYPINDTSSVFAS